MLESPFFELICFYKFFSFGEHVNTNCIIAKFGDGRIENYVNTIEIDELEMQSFLQWKMVRPSFLFALSLLLIFLCSPIFSMKGI